MAPHSDTGHSVRVAVDTAALRARRLTVGAQRQLDRRTVSLVCRPLKPGPTAVTEEGARSWLRHLASGPFLAAMTLYIVVAES
ncbi:hypothetical protein [Streptomyces sp. BE133]|uniref:hypothetical protein n=1 Tax=Streptomyces sp. BE133 TaxID=3002523 RepID=UPI002E78E8F9|nr:hypothetical protein [Streptomyces sp. BE133]MEE1811049.1 hypothetical protein [Streptomyces sp. BE133]